MQEAAEAVAGVAIRRATAADARPVATMITRLVGEFVEVGPEASGPDDGVLACARRMLALRDSVFGLIAEAEGAPVGVLMVNERAALTAGDVYGKLTELYICPRWRGRGVAGALLDAAAALGRERGWTRLEIGRPTTLDRSKAEALFAAKGFRPADQRLRLPLR